MEKIKMKCRHCSEQRDLSKDEQMLLDIGILQTTYTCHDCRQGAQNGKRLSSDIYKVPIRSPLGESVSG